MYSVQFELQHDIPGVFISSAATPLQKKHISPVVFSAATTVNWAVKLKLQWLMGSSGPENSYWSGDLKAQ